MLKKFRASLFLSLFLSFVLRVWGQAFVAKPLNDLGAGKYKGFSGGLYEKGSNELPRDHGADGLALAAQVKPVRGKFVFLGIGMSNATIEFRPFVEMAESNAKVNHATMAVLNGAKGAMTACFWRFATENPVEKGCRAPRPIPNQYDRIRDEVLKPAGLAEDQVEVIWMLNADPRPSIALPSPDADAYVYEREIGEIARAARARYPNLKLMFVSSRVYAGYASRPLNPEPYAYEYGFSVKWAIQAQVDQLRSGKADSMAGDLDYKKGVAPWIAWGPYLWADGDVPRSDGLIWKASEFQEDGTHPNRAGVEKVAGMLMDFFMKSEYATWFRK
jgi:lysophospholipase L1-like esterase